MVFFKYLSSNFFLHIFFFSCLLHFSVCFSAGFSASRLNLTLRLNLTFPEKTDILMSEAVWYRDKGKLRLGQVCRYVLTYSRATNPAQDAVQSDSNSVSELTYSQDRIFLRLKNLEKSSLRAIHLLNGPYVIYCHVVPCNYNHRTEFVPENDVDSNEVVFKNDLKPGQTMNVELFRNKNSLLRLDGGTNYYQWTVDIISQIVVSRRVVTQYDLLIGSDLKALKKLNHGPFNGLNSATTTIFNRSKSSPRTSDDKVSTSRESTSFLLSQTQSTCSPLSEKSIEYPTDKVNRNPQAGGEISKPSLHLGHHSHPHLHNHKHLQYSFPEEDEEDGIPFNHSSNPFLLVQRLTGDDIWNNEPKYPNKPVHLVIVTHGIFSNVQGDMLYLKDSIESSPGSDNCLIRGYTGNAGRSEKGIKKLGIGIGHYIVDVLEELSAKYKVDKISFIGHSLGGVVQLYGLKYLITIKGADFFKKKSIQPTHLIALATPFLGVLSEMSFYISWFLDIGALGKTGRDMTLSRKIPTFKDLRINKQEHAKDSFKPLLEVLPDDPLHTLMAQFKHLTLYANAVNDGIVPLRTSSLLYLDWEALGKVGGIHRDEGGGEDSSAENTETIDPDNEGDIETVESKGSEDGNVGQVPEKDEDVEDVVEQRKENRGQKKDSGDESLPFDPLNIFGKKGMSRREKKFMMVSTEGFDARDLEDSKQSDPTIDLDTLKLPIEPGELNIPPKASAIESAWSTLMFPVPPTKYILSPLERHGVVFHDKYYQLKDLDDKAQVEKRSIFLEIVFGKGPNHKTSKQVEIAKKYHLGLTWRKVLVKLPQDAHNNIIVRRRFSNGYGWGVIDHLAHLFDEKVILKM